MKTLTILFSAIYSLSCFSQEPNPELFQTWYLTYIQENDFATPYNVNEIVPAISPTLTISNNLSFSGEGACNNFNGTFTNVTSDSFETSMFIPTLLICSPQIHYSIEISYFEFLQSARYYQITPQGQGLVLTMFNPIFGQAIFQNFALNRIDFDSEQIAIYPNPTNSTIFLNFKQLVVSNIQVVNSIGQNVKTINNNFESINMSDLNSGIYILKIDTNLGTINKKIVRD